MRLTTVLSYWGNVLLHSPPPSFIKWYNSLQLSCTNLFPWSLLYCSSPSLTVVSWLFFLLTAQDSPWYHKNASQWLCKSEHSCVTILTWKKCGRACQRCANQATSNGCRCVSCQILHAATTMMERAKWKWSRREQNEWLPTAERWCWNGSKKEKY